MLFFYVTLNGVAHTPQLKRRSTHFYTNALDIFGFYVTYFSKNRRFYDIPSLFLLRLFRGFPVRMFARTRRLVCGLPLPVGGVPVFLLLPPTVTPPVVALAFATSFVVLASDSSPFSRMSLFPPFRLFAVVRKGSSNSAIATGIAFDTFVFAYQKVDNVILALSEFRQVPGV